MDEQNKIKEGNHYLPRTYLKHFLLDDKLFMYKKGKKFFEENITMNNRVIVVNSEKGLNNIAKENNLYTVKVNGKESDLMEDAFRKMGEDFYNTGIVKKIERKKEGDLIEEELKEKICIFLAMMLIRTPRYKFDVEDVEILFKKVDFFNLKHNKDEKKVLIKKLNKKRSEKLDIEKFDSIIDSFLNEDTRVGFSNELFIRQGLEMFMGYAQIFMDMKATIYKSDEHFLTSDNPVVYFVPSGKTDFYNPAKSLMSPHTELFFPLTKNLGLHLARKDKEEKIIKAPQGFAEKCFNYNIAHNSWQFIFTPSKMIFLEKFIEQYIPYPFIFKHPDFNKIVEKFQKNKQHNEDTR